MKKLQLLNLGEFGTVLASREEGRRAADKVQDAAEHGGVVVSFHGVEIATTSFLDEVVLRAGQLLRTKKLILIVTGLDQEVRESLALVVKSRDMRLAYFDDDRIKLLGGSRMLNQTLEAAQQLGSFKAPELADRLKLKLPNLHQRLAVLSESGALAREDDGTTTRGGPGHDFLAPRPEDLNPRKLAVI